MRRFDIKERSLVGRYWSWENQYLVSCDLAIIPLSPESVFISKFFLIYLFLFYVSEGFACIYVCVPHACLMPAEVRRSPETGFMGGCEPMWVLGIEQRSSARMTRARSHWALCPLTDSCWGRASHLAHGRQGKLLFTFSPTQLLNKLPDWKYKNWALSSNPFYRGTSDLVRRFMPSVRRVRKWKGTRASLQCALTEGWGPPLPC